MLWCPDACLEACACRQLLLPVDWITCTAAHFNVHACMGSGAHGKQGAHLTLLLWGSKSFTSTATVLKEPAQNTSTQIH